MPTLSDTAICLRCWDFSETSQTVSLLTREHGLLRGLAKGARRERGSFSGGFDLFTRGRIVAIVKPGRDLATLTEWKLEGPHRWLHFDLRANRAAFLAADLAGRMLDVGDPHPVVYDALAAALEEMAGPDAVAGALARFQWRLLEDAGYRPELDRDVRSGEDLPDGLDVVGFAPHAGGTVAEAEGTDRWKVRRATLDLLRTLAAGAPLPAGVPADVLERLNKLLALYARELIGRDLPSLEWAFGRVPGSDTTPPAAGAAGGPDAAPRR